MASYQTAQKKMLIDFLTLHRERAFSTEELYTEMKKEYREGEIPGKSTVYRLVHRMVADGTIKRFVKDDGRSFMYQLVGDEHCASHLHLKCTDCGRILHMDDDESLRIMLQVMKNNHFEVDNRLTVLVGKCSHCKTLED